MTKINPESPVVRETAATHRGDPLIVELHPGYMVLRVKGKRSLTYMLDYETAFERAVKQAAVATMPAKPKKVSRGLLQFTNKY